MSLTIFSFDLLRTLGSKAEALARSRLHLNIHKDYDEPCQRFLNSICVSSYIRPHRHALDPKCETLVAIKGLFALLTFNAAGDIDETVIFGTERYEETGGLSVGVDVSPNTWHTVIALVPESVLLEIKAGPFDPNRAKEPAPWAPDECSAEAPAYLAMLNARVAHKFPKAV